MTFRAPVFALAALAVLFLACMCTPTPAPTPQPLPDESDLGVSGQPLWPPGVLELGLSPYSSGFVPFASSFDFEHGPQGGVHVPFAWQVHAEPYEQARFVVRVRRVSDGLLLNQAERLANSGAATFGPDGGALFSGELRVFLCPAKGVDLVGVPVSFELTVIGNDGGFLGRSSAVSTTQEPDCKQP